MDNADDKDMVVGGTKGPGIIEYFPQSEYSVILLTTRSTEVAESVAENEEENWKRALSWPGRVGPAGLRRKGEIGTGATGATIRGLTRDNSRLAVAFDPRPLLLYLR